MSLGEGGTHERRGEKGAPSVAPSGVCKYTIPNVSCWDRWA